jgi:hypothetical protein
MQEAVDPEVFLLANPAAIGTIRQAPGLPGAWYQRVFDPDHAAAKFEERNGARPPSLGDPVSTGSAAGSRLLEQMARDASGGWRRLLIGNEKMLANLEDLRLVMPNFAAPLELIMTTIRASARTRRPIRLPPMLLNGVPGTGKTRFAQKLGKALCVPTTEIAMPSATGTNILTGTDLSWKAARPGRLTAALAESPYAGPVVFLDEIEKVYTHAGEQPLDVLHMLWERQSALKTRDECLEIDFAADHVIWIASCNETRTIRPSLLDRLRVFDVPRPAPRQMKAIVTAIYADLVDEWHGWFETDLAPDIIAQISAEPPRRIKSTLADAMTHAAADDRHSIKAEDIARAIIAENRPARAKFGFV